MFESSASVHIQASQSVVWDALTRPELVKRYFFGTVMTTDWKPGSPVTFRGEWEGQAYEDVGTVLTYDAPNSLSFNYWSSFSGEPDVAEKRQIIRYSVLPADEGGDGAGVVVTIRQSNSPTQAAADHSAKNWEAVLVAMKSLVETGR